MSVVDYMNKYEFLFPFERIKYGSNILIYGAGDVGCAYLKQVLLTQYCGCSALIDKNAENIHALLVPVFTPDKIPTLNYDYIVLAFKDGCNIQAVKDTLYYYGVDDSKIIYQAPRADINVLSDRENVQNNDYAYKKDGVSVAIKFGPCLGDSIIKKKALMEIVKMINNCHIDIYAPSGTKFLPSIYSGTKGINAIIDDSGIMFNTNTKKYDISLEMYDLMVVKYINNNLINNSELLYSKLQMLKKKLEEYNLQTTPISNMHIHFRRMIYKGLNAYNYLNFTGVFDIQDRDVEITLNDKYSDDYKKLGLKKYVTINYGTGFASEYGKNVTAKQWGYDKLCKFVSLFKNKFPNISVVQLGTKNALHIPNVDLYCIGNDLELVKYILYNSQLHIDSEGGLVHLATQLHTKCVVLFGPTMPEYFGYLENDNIMAGTCHGCYTLYDEIDKCARDMSCPECMDKITPEMVMEVVCKNVNSFYDKRL